MAFPFFSLKFLILRCGPLPGISAFGEQLILGEEDSDVKPVSSRCQTRPLRASFSLPVKWFGRNICGNGHQPFSEWIADPWGFPGLFKILRHYWPLSSH